MKSNVKYQWSRINWLWCLQRCSVFSKAVKAKQIISHQSNCIIYEVGIFLTFRNSPVNIWLQYMLCADVMLPLKYWMPVKRYVLISDWPAYFFFPAALLNPEQSFHLSQHIQEAVSSVQTASGRFVICFHLKVQTILKILYEKLR